MTKSRKYDSAIERLRSIEAFIGQRSVADVAAEISVGVRVATQATRTFPTALEIVLIDLLKAGLPGHVEAALAVARADVRAAAISLRDDMNAELRAMEVAGRKGG